jgi:hypothetical protein
MINMGECQLCGNVRKLAQVQDHVICEQCYHAVIAILMRILKDPEIWKLINDQLVVSYVDVVSLVDAGYTEPDAPAEPSVASFRNRSVASRRRSHKNLY